jgi:BirA family biotin operon repressor/biotin-[acetyl-CoA-carboxylase] ligase
VLAEVRLHAGRVEQLILGVGVNLNIDRPSMDHVFGAAAAGATSVREATGDMVDRNVFAARLLESLEQRLFDFLAHGKGPVLTEWRRRSFLGRRVIVREEDIHVEGVALDLDDDGCLVVALDDGSTVRVREGEVLPLGHGPREGE